MRIPLFDGAASAPDNKTQKQAADAPAKPDILVLCGWQGCTLARGSGRTGIRYGMVKVKHRQALQALRRQLA